VVGLCDPLDINFDLESYPYWTQISISENLVVPEQKPDIEQINSIIITVNIIKKKVIVTPTSTGENQEGKILTGRKIIIEGELCQTVQYTADVPEQSVHSAHFLVPFSAFIIVPVLINTVDTLDINFEINSCVEDVFIIDYCKRNLFKNVTLFLQAVPTSSE
jgi:hypothetical protein